MDYTILATEVSTDPLTRGYIGMTDIQVANDINTFYRPAEGGIDGMVRYLATHDNRTNEGGDTNASLILGRLETAARADPYTDPFERAGIWRAGGSGANEQIALDATANTVTFGTAHVITSLADKDAITLSGTTSDDGYQQIVSVVGQVVTLPSITTDETLERVMRVHKMQDAKHLTPEYIQNAKALINLFLAPSLLEIDFIDTEIELAFADMVTAGVWKAADTDALKALSQNQQSRASELGLPRITDTDVSRVRA